MGVRFVIPDAEEREGPSGITGVAPWVGGKVGDAGQLRRADGEVVPGRHRAGRVASPQFGGALGPTAAEVLPTAAESLKEAAPASRTPGTIGWRRVKLLKEFLKYLAVNAAIWAVVGPRHWVPFMPGDPAGMLQGLVALSLFMGIPALVVLLCANAVAEIYPTIPLRVPLAIGLFLTALLFLLAISRTPLYVQFCVQACYVLIARSAWPKRWVADREATGESTSSSRP